MYGLVAFVAIAGYARSGARRLAIAVAVCVAGLWQVAEGFLPWWGNGDPNGLMYGTFYWHNQFGSYVCACALVGAALTVTGPRLARVAAVPTVLLASAGAVFSTSRASLALLALGWAALAPLAWRAGRRGRLAWAAIPAGVAAVVLLLSSPVVFPSGHYHFFLLPGAHNGRGLSTLDSNGGARVLFAKAALANWAHHPVLGTGFGSFLTASVARMPLGFTLSP